MGYNVNTDLVRADKVFLYLFDATAVTEASAFTSANTQVIAFATSCSLQIDGQTIDTSNKMSGRWNSNLAGKNGYSVSCDALYTTASGATSFDALLAKMVAGNAVGWAMAQANDDVNFYINKDEVVAYGAGLITSLSLNAENNNVASSSISITGSGDIKTA